MRPPTRNPSRWTACCSRTTACTRDRRWRRSARPSSTSRPSPCCGTTPATGRGRSTLDSRPAHDLRWPPPLPMLGRRRRSGRGRQQRATIGQQRATIGQQRDASSSFAPGSPKNPLDQHLHPGAPTGKGGNVAHEHTRQPAPVSTASANAQAFENRRAASVCRSGQQREYCAHRRRSGTAHRAAAAGLGRCRRRAVGAASGTPGWRFPRAGRA